MKIVCNGKERNVDDGMSVLNLLAELGLDPETVVVEVDGKIVLKDDYESSPLREGSVLELIKFVGGG